MTTAPVDPNVSLPPAVKAAAERAATVHAAAYQTPPTPQPQTPAPAAPAADAMVQLSETPAPAPEVPTAVPPVPAFQPVQQPIAAPAAPQTERNWEADYRSMEGRDKQKAQEINNLRQMLGQLSDEVTALRAAPPPLPNTGVPAPFQNTRRFVTDEDVKNFGPDLQGFVERASAQALTPIIAQLEAKVNQVNQGVAQRSQQQVWSALDATIPNWRVVNRHPAFKAWSSLRDVKSGRVNGDLLRDAFQLGDPTRTQAIFQDFLQEQGEALGLSNPTPQTQAQPPAPVPPSAQVPLASIAAPGRVNPNTGGGQQQPGTGSPTYTHSQVRWFYSNAGKQYYQGREAERVADEQDLFRAQREGRVVSG